MSSTTLASLRATIGDYLEQGQFDLANDHCLEALREHPDDAILLMYMARIDEHRGLNDKAIQGLQRAVKVHPDEPAPQVELARILANSGRLEEAMTTLETCIDLSPNHVGARSLLGRCQFRVRQFEAARSSWHTARRIDPDHAPSLTGLSELSLRDNDIPQAHTYAAQAVNSAPQDALAQIQMARVFALQGQMDFAKRCLDNAVELLPDNHEIIVARAGLLSLEGRHSEVLEMIEQAGARGLHHHRLDLQKARSTLASQGLQAARSIYDRLIQSSPEGGDIFLELAGFHLAQGEFDEFTALIEEHADKVPEYEVTWLEARHASMTGDRATSLQLVEQLVDCEEAELRILSRLHLAQAALDEPNPNRDKVAACLEPLVSEPQLGVAAAWQIARLSELNGEDERIIRLLTPLLKRDGLTDSQRRKTRALLALALDRSGRYTEAGDCLLDSAWKGPFHAEAAVSLELPVNDSSDAVPAIDHADRVVFFHAWPGMGLDALLPVLSTHPNIIIQDPSKGPERLQRLFPAPGTGEEADQNRWPLIRSRYLRPLRDFPHLTMFEPTPLKLAHLPRIAALFPGAAVIAPRIQPDMMRLHWQFMGYAEVQSMTEQWQTHEESLKQLPEEFPLNVIEYDLARLVDQPEQEMEKLFDQLGLDVNGIDFKLLRDGLKQNHYRPSDHWRHYASEPDRNG